MKRQYIQRTKLPDTPGVYIFKDYQKRPLYIGRATSLADRVKSYFSNDLITARGPRIVDMVTKAVSLDVQQTDSVLESIILESALIKKYQPPYNVDERDDKSSYYVIITDEVWPRVFLERARDFDDHRNKGTLTYAVKAHFGPYPQSGLIKEALRIIRKLFPFKDKKSFDARHDAFYQMIGRSPVPSDTNAQRRYMRTIDNIILFFEGKKDMLRSTLSQEMASAADALQFEEAGELKKVLYALDHINDFSLIKKEREHNPARHAFKIEAYDIAHLAGTNVVGAFVVSVNGEYIPAEYRTFILSRQKNDDIAGLTEILNRRLNHTEWAYPDLIVVDGNETHLARAEAVLKARRIAIPVIAVTKDEHHTAERLSGPRTLIEAYTKDCIALNAEAHRFVVKFHRARRRLLKK